jgi:hypothetical protein
MTQYPDIGHGNAAQLLNDVLLPANARFGQKQTRETLRAVADPAWAMHDRLWHDQGCPDKEKFRADLFKDCPELELLRDYVDTGKHFGLDRKSVRLVSLTGAENPGGVIENTGPLGTLITTPECTLMFNTSDGKSYKATDVIKRVIDFWVKKLNLTD